jgi:membrane-associated phospholipid phosphatase
MASLIHTLSRQSTGARISKVEASRRSHWLIVWIYFVVAAVSLAALAFLVHGAGPLPIDLAASRAVQSFHAQWFDLLMRGVGEPGYPLQVYGWLGVMFLLLFKSGLKWETVMAGFATVGIGVVGLIVKIIVDRPRPSPSLINVLNPALDGGKYSFPAGHVQVYMAIIGFLLFLSITLPHKYAWTRVVEIIGFGTALALIGISRAYTGEHWPTDVMGGYLLGSLWLILTIWLYEWGRARFTGKTRSSEK